MFENFNTNPYNIQKKLLYHYTGPEKLFKILTNMHLKFSRFDNLNDLNEIEVNFQITDFNLELNIQDYILKNCGLVSFTKDHIIDEKVEEWGINHARMWAQYADNNKGACLVLNEEKLIKKNPKLRECKFFTIEDVVYDIWTLSGIQEHSVDSETVILNNYKELFFKKSNDWELERERRLFLLGDLEFIDINDCVEYICLGFRFDMYDSLIKIFLNNFNNGKQIFTLHCIAKQINSYGRINPQIVAFIILDHLKKTKNNTQSYLNYLKEIGY